MTLDSNMSDLSDASVEDAVVEDVLNAQKRKLIPVNNVAGLLSKLKEIQLNLDWVEKLDTTVNVSALPSEQSKESAAVDTVAENDFKREMSFCNQAMSATSKALKRLEKLGIPTKRPADFLAEMAKSDAHMKKVREKLLSKQLIVERSEKVRAIREQKKQGKKIQQEVLQQKREEKKKMLNALKKTKKGKMGADKLLEEKKIQGKPIKNKRNREFRDSKYGYGGKKKGAKWNTADSSAMYPGKQKEGPKNKFSKDKKQKWFKPRAKKHRRRR